MSDAPKLTANWIVNELLREIKDLPVSELPFTGDALGELVLLISAETISGKIGKQVFSELLRSGTSPNQFVKENNLQQISDPEIIQTLIDQVLLKNPEMLQEYRDGQRSRFGFFVGRVLQSSDGKANPKLVNELLKLALQ